MKRIVFFGLLCLPYALSAQDGFTLKGKIGTLNAPAMVFLTYRDAGTSITDSAYLKDGFFTFTGKVTAPVQAGLSIRHNDPAAGVNRPDYTGFYLENAVITISSPDSARNARITGSKTNDDNITLTNMRRPYKRSADSLVAVYNAMSKEERQDSAFRKAAAHVMQVTAAGYDSLSRVFIKNHPESHISLLAFKEVELAYNFNPDLAAARFLKFPVSMRTTPLGKQLESIIETGRKTNTGVMAMDFTQTDPEGNKVKLSDYRGQYVLIDFWASWCAPCRAENPNLLKAYTTYQRNNFTILGVSLDEEEYKKAWLKAIEVDGMPWKQVSDLKGWKNEAAQLYGISAIPANFLVDPEGKIIARNLRGEELQEKLAALFDTP